MIPDLDTVHALINDALRDLRVSMPATVTRVHTDERSNRQFINVKPSIASRYFDDDGQRQTYELPELHMVPVCYPQGAPFFMSWPLAVGSIVMLLVADNSLKLWIEQFRAGQKNVHDAVDPGVHLLDGAVALPFGPPTRESKLADVHAENLVIGVDGGGQIHVTPGGEILLGGASVTAAVALATKVDMQLELLRTAIDAAAVTEAGASGVGGMSALKTNLDAALNVPPGWPATVAAEKVKAE